MIYYFQVYSDDLLEHYQYFGNVITTHFSIFGIYEVHTSFDFEIIIYWRIYNVFDWRFDSSNHFDVVIRKRQFSYI